MVYDYFVSDIDDDTYGKYTSPNMPLYGIPKKPDFSVSATIGAYLSGGAKPSQLLMGVAFYGHAWNIGTTYKGTSFAEYGLVGTEDNGCCGPFAHTYGAQSGPIIQLCGTLGYSEIVDVFKGQYVYVEDNFTQTTIGYNNKEGVWVSFQSQKALSNFINYAQSLNLGGIFIFDISMDLKNAQDQWTFPVTTSLCHQMKGMDNNCPSIVGCMNDCSGKGECNNVGQCECTENFFGDDCSFFFCSADTDCSGHGTCEQGLCSCDSGWYGTTCSQAQSQVCGDAKFYGFSCTGGDTFTQCAAGKEAAQYSCPAGTMCQCNQSQGTPCGTTSSPAVCLAIQ